jgi:hypothetical protein
MFGLVGLAADYVGTVNVADLTEVRVRAGQGAGSGTAQAPSPGFDLVNEPRVGVHVTDRRWDWTLGGALRMTLPDVEQGPELTLTPAVGSVSTLQLFGTGSASVGWHDRRVRIVASENATYGWFNAGYLVPAASMGPPIGPGGPTPVQPSAAPQTIETVGSRSALTTDVRIGRREQLEVSAAWLVAGGTDAASQAVLPLVQGPRLDALYSYALSRRDRLTTAGYAQSTSFSPFPCPVTSAVVSTMGGLGAECAPQDEIVEVREGFAHAFARSTLLRGSAGLTLGVNRVERDLPFQSSLYPSADVNFTHSWGDRGRVALELGGAIAPFVDPRTGLLFERAGGQAALSDRLSRKVAVRVFGDGLQTLPTTDPAALSMVSGGAEVGVATERWLTLVAGARGLAQSQGALGWFSATIGYVDVTLATDLLQF